MADLKVFSRQLCASIVGAAMAIVIAPNAAQAIAFLSTGNGQVGEIDPVTGTFSALPNPTPVLTDIALSGSGELFGVTFSDLFSIDASTGASSLVGGLGATLNALGFSTDNTLYGAGGSSFYSVDTLTGTASLVANISGFSSSGDIVFDPTNDRFLATSSAFDGVFDGLFSIALDGSSAAIGSIGFSNVFGLFFDDGTLYGYTADGQQLVIDPATGAGVFDRNVTALEGQIFGAASLPSTGPSVPEPATVLGLIGVSAFFLSRDRHRFAARNKF